MKNKTTRYLTVILAVWLLITGLPMTAFAEEDEETTVSNISAEEIADTEKTNLPNNGATIFHETDSEKVTITNDHVSTENQVWQTPVINNHVVSNSDILEIYIDNHDIENYNITAEGIDIVSSSTDTGKISLYAKEEFGKLIIESLREDETKHKYTLYTYKTDTQTYVSDVSRDAAWHLAMQDELDKGIITQYEYECLYAEYSQRFLISDISMVTDTDAHTLHDNTLVGKTLNNRSADTYTLSGSLGFYDDGGHRYSLKRVKVELFQDQLFGYEFIAETYTDDNGEYVFNLNKQNMAKFDNKSLCIRFYPCNENVFVRNLRISLSITNFLIDTAILDYMQTPSYKYSSSSLSDVLSMNVSYDADDSMTAAFHIHQGMIMGEIFTEAQGYEISNYTLNVFYPVTENSGVSYQGLCGIGKNVFADYDTIIHEYGHFVQQMKDCYGATLWDMVVGGFPNHKKVNDHFEDKWTTEYAMELTWSEAWASVFSMLVQYYFKEEYSFTDYGNHYYSYRNINGYSSNLDENACEAQELAVMAMLYDLYEDNDDIPEIFDNVHWNYYRWFNWTTQQGMYTLADFIGYILSEKTTYIPQIANIMQAHRISPTITSTSPSTLTPALAPIIEWTPNGSINNPNAVAVAIYDQDWACIYSQDIATIDYDEEKIFHFPQIIWEDIFRRFTGVQKLYLVMVGCKKGDSDQSGPYFSNVIEIQVNQDISVTFNPNENYKEVKIGIPVTGMEEIRVTFSESGYVVMQTFGIIDVTMEIVNANNQSIIKAFNDTNDQGYGTNAYARIYVTAGNEYIIKIKCTYFMAAGRTKLAMFYAGESVNVSNPISEYNIISYEMIPPNNQSLVISIDSTDNYMHTLRITPFSTNEYVIGLTGASIDIALYVIDPISNKILTSPKDFCLDSIPDIQKRLESGKEYLILLGADYPNDFESSDTWTLAVLPVIS